ncbi:Transcription factor AP-4 [Trichinella papuae]|uniref:Transcription factor AP-4 n=1 Tax=Trichinella papuae TaxID=268474 RepID=A0A0V1NAN6_9BILA|nr:Transcription factor AP-4 [Trichinella papuae]
MKNASDQRCQLDIEDNDENDDCSDPDYESKVRVSNKSSTPMKESTGSNSVPPAAAAAAAAAAAVAATTVVTTKHHGRHHRLDPEKRLRREIANSNERRRMQSINAGFQALKAMLPRREEEKMSKAAILQQTAEHVHSLNCKVEDITRKLVKLQKAYDSKGFQAQPWLEESELVDVGVQTMQMSLLSENNRYPEAMAGVGGGSSRKRLKSCRGSDSAGIARLISKSSVACQTDFIDNTSVEFKYMKHQIIELRIAYDHERQLRLLREKQYRSLEMNHFNSLSQVSGVSMLDFPVNSCHQATLLPVGSGFAPTVQVPFSTPAAVVTSSLPTHQSPFLTVSKAAESANVVHVSSQTSGTQGVAPVFSPSALAAVSAMLSPTTVSVSGWNAAAAAAHSSDSAGCFSSFASISAAAAPPPPPPTLAIANHGNFLNSGQVTMPQTKGLGSIIDAVRLLEGDHLFSDLEQNQTTINNTKADNTAAASSRRQKEMNNNFPKKEPPNNGQCNL